MKIKSENIVMYIIKTKDYFGWPLAKITGYLYNYGSISIIFPTVQNSLLDNELWLGMQYCFYGMFQNVAALQIIPLTFILWYGFACENQKYFACKFYCAYSIQLKGLLIYVFCPPLDTDFAFLPR